MGALFALYRRDATGRGDLVEVSAQACVVTALSHAPAFVDLNGVEPTRAGAFITGRSIKGARYRVFWPCRDGHINFIFYGGTAGRRTNEQLVSWMRDSGADLGALAAIDWKNWDPTSADQAEVDAIETPVLKFFAGISKREFLTQGHRREMLGYPVATVGDIAADPQLEARDFFQSRCRLAGTLLRQFCGDRRRAPAATPCTGRSVCNSPASGRGMPCSCNAGTERKMTAVPQAAAGLKVLEFGGYAAGPHIGKLLANFGASTVHVRVETTGLTVFAFSIHLSRMTGQATTAAAASPFSTTRNTASRLI